MHVIADLPRYPILHRAAQIAFIILLSSVLLSGIFRLFVYSAEAGCKTRTSIDFIPIPRLEISCQGFPFAEEAEGFLNVFLNLAPMSAFASVLSLVVAIVLIQGGSTDYSFARILGFAGITFALIALDALALLYFLHLIARLRRWPAYRKATGWKEVA